MTRFQRLVQAGWPDMVEAASRPGGSFYYKFSSGPGGEPIDGKFAREFVEGAETHMARYIQFASFQRMLPSEFGIPGQDHRGLAMAFTIAGHPIIVAF